MAQSFIKDPVENLDYMWDWAPLTSEQPGADSDWLQSGEIIVSHTITTTPGITFSNDLHTDTQVQVWLSGGTVGTSYIIVCLILTNHGRTSVRRITIKIQER
jgi:hypothetical protein